jgi:hypothetical protein
MQELAASIDRGATHMEESAVRANVIEEKFGHIRTGSDCEPLSNMSRAEADVDQLSQG